MFGNGRYMSIDAELDARIKLEDARPGGRKKMEDVAGKP